MNLIQKLRGRLSLRMIEDWDCGDDAGAPKGTHPVRLKMQRTGIGRLG